VKDRTGNRYTGEPYESVITLRDNYFHKQPAPSAPSQPAGPEGLVLLAHHGAGVIADRDDKWAIQIKPEGITRGFVPGSLAVLAACSVGTMGENQTDNLLLLNKLNRNKMTAAIVSTFKVPSTVAELFLKAIGETLQNGRTADTPLYQVFVETKKRYRELAANRPSDLPLVEVFMLVGDGDTKVCKNKE
jgi:hypothetical protein